MKNRRCVIISGAPEFAKGQIRTGDYVIACDSGYEHAVNNGIVPDIIMGDFDSCRLQLPENVEILKAPCEKDDTDTMLAVKYGLEHGFRNFILLGALGGRFDHTLANLSTAAYIAQQCGTCCIISRDCYIFSIKDNELVLERKEYEEENCKCYVSVFSYTEHVRVTYQGLKYPLTGIELDSTFPLGISNEFVSEKATINVSGGIALAVVSLQRN